MQNQGTGILSRYRAIVVAIAIFILIDFALIAYNVYSSYRIDRLTAIRDLSGSERSSSQIVLRALLEMQDDRTAGRPIDAEPRKALHDRATLIENATSVLRNGGTMPGDPEVFRAADTPTMRASVDKIVELWQPYYALLQPLLSSTEVDGAALLKAVEYARSNNTALFAAINGLVNDTQDRVEAETKTLRVAQIVGVLLALANFLFTALLAFRRLLANDRAIAKSQKQTGDILATVKEGLFLLTPDFCVGEQMSASLKDVLHRDVQPGFNLLGALATMVDKNTLEAAKDYVELLFGKRVKESLVYSLNPLSEVAVSGEATRGETRYLSFQFNRVLENEQVSYLLVTVQDATERVNLAAQVAATKQRTREEMEVLLRVLSNDPVEVRDFVRRAESALEQVNESLRQAARRTGENYIGLVNSLFRSVHSIKSEAAALHLEMFESIAHEFEADLIALRDKDDIEGADMVKLTLRLDDLFESLTSLKSFLDRVSGATAESAQRKPSQRLVETFQSLAQRIAADHGKHVDVTAELAAFDTLPTETMEQLRTIGLQLLRNAVAHGIESPHERAAATKSAAGVVHFACRDVGNNTIEFTVRDDGRGLSPTRIRETLLRSGHFAPEQIQALSDRDVVMKIFEPGFSTAASSSRDAGRGVGMDLVRSTVRALSGRISFSTAAQRYTEFRVRFPAVPHAAAVPLRSIA